MHLADGILSMPMTAITSIGAAAVLVYSIKGTEEKEIAKISLVAAAFFVSSLIRIPIGPTSVHPVLMGLMGFILGRRAVVAVFVGLLLQALLFQHGGITTLGANMLIHALPALAVYWMTRVRKVKSIFYSGVMYGSVAVIGALLLLVSFLWMSHSGFAAGNFNVIHLVILVYIPVIIVEGLLTGFALKYIYKVRPSFITSLSKWR